MKKIVILPLILMLVLALVACGSDNDEGLTLEERITNAIHKVAGKEVDGEDSIMSLSVTFTGEGEAVRAVIKSEALSAKLFKKQLLIKSKDLLKKLSEMSEIVFVNIEWQGKFADSYGNIKFNPVMRVDMTRETMDKINWENFDYTKIEKIADDYWQHMGL